MKSANLALRFLLELCLLVALGYWGFRAGEGLLGNIVLGLGAPLLAAVVWGIFISPRARLPVSRPVRLVMELVLFGAAVVALAAAGQPGLAIAFALIVLINEVLLLVWKQ